jgi:hypothetical protein
LKRSTRTTSPDFWILDSIPNIALDPRMAVFAEPFSFDFTARNETTEYDPVKLYEDMVKSP